MNQEEAAARARTEIPDDCVLLPDASRRVRGGWYFMFQSEEYVRTGDPKKMLVGHGGLIVDDITGEVSTLGSGVLLEQQIAAWEWGLKQDRYDLVISEASDPDSTAELLSRLSLRYFIPEQDGDNVWRISRLYERQRLAERLQHLPCTFRDQGFDSRAPEILDELTALGCRWELRTVINADRGRIGDELPPD
jgi:hypothetical protein